MASQAFQALCCMYNGEVQVVQPKQVHDSICHCAKSEHVEIKSIEDVVANTNLIYGHLKFVCSLKILFNIHKLCRMKATGGGMICYLACITPIFAGLLTVEKFLFLCTTAGLQMCSEAHDENNQEISSKSRTVTVADRDPKTGKTRSKKELQAAANSQAASQESSEWCEECCKFFMSMVVVTVVHYSFQIVVLLMAIMFFMMLLLPVIFCIDFEGKTEAPASSAAQTSPAEVEIMLAEEGRVPMATVVGAAPADDTAGSDAAATEHLQIMNR